MNIIMINLPALLILAGIVLTFFLVFYFVKMTERWYQTWTEIHDAAKNLSFSQIDHFRNTLPYSKWGEDIDNAERQIIDEIISRTHQVSPQEIRAAFNRSYRFGTGYKNHCGKFILSHLDDRMRYLRTVKTFSDKEMGDIKTLAQIVHHSPYLKEIKLLEENLISEVREEALKTFAETY